MANTIPFHVSNQQSVDFRNFKPILADLNADLETGTKNSLKSITDALFTPLQSGDVQIVLNNKPYTKDNLISDLTESLTSTDDKPKINDQLSVIFHQANQYKDNHVENFKNVIATSTLIANNEPLPSNTTIYTFDTDIQQPAKAQLSTPSDQNLSDLHNGLFGTLLQQPLNENWAFILIKDSQEFNDVKDQLNQLITQGQPANDTAQKNNDIQSIQADDQAIFTSIVTGNDNEAGQINRYLMRSLVLSMSDILPINIHSLIAPLGFSFINLTNLANATQHEYNKELQQLANVTNKLVKFKMASFKRINTAKNIDQAAQKRSAHKDFTKTSNEILQRKQFGFHKTMPTVKQQLNRLTKILNSATSNLMSDNSYKQTRTTFMRPNRRYPNDPNLRGTIQTTHYHPDIHIYLDTSGSISESQYKTAVTMLIMITQKLKTNLYFTSFSHYITPPVKLVTKNVSPAIVYTEIQRVPKASGGTEYENVWNMIDAINRQTRTTGQAPRINFIITDFAYDLRSSWTPRINQPSTNKTYYIPLAADQYDYDTCRKFAMEFANELIDHGDLNIKSRILM